MNSYGKFFTESLYPVQDGVIRVINDLHTPFYLTGGTALSRGYFNHRYSDDLDFFVNNHAGFNGLISGVIASLSGKFDLLKKVEAHDYIQLFITVGDVKLKIDLVNDTAVHHGEIITHENLGRIDGLLNILTNKITALHRYEPKDVADILAICRNYSFSWSKVFALAGEKEAGVQPVLISEIIKDVPDEQLREVKWTADPDFSAMRKDLDRIALDVLAGDDNSLSLSKQS